MTGGWDADREHDVAALAAILLGGPWRVELLQIRVARALGHLVVTADVAAFVTALLDRFPLPPAESPLLAFLAGWHARGDLRGPPRLVSVAVLPAAVPGAAHVPDRDALLRLLDVDAGELDWFADLQLRERRCAPPLRHYRWRVLPKRGGHRLVAAPKPRLKEIQRRVLRHVLASVPLHEAAHGCVPGRSVGTALAPHAGRAALVRLDLASFFPSVSHRRVDGLLRCLGLAPDVARVLTGLCTTVVPFPVWRELPHDRELPAIEAHRRLGAVLAAPHLPQGAPSSPALANAIAYRLDRRLAGLATRWEATYTRYVDDLIFSGGRRLRARPDAFVDAVREVAVGEGFRLAERKTAIARSGARMAALGAVVNDHPTVARPERDRLRAIVHNCVVHGGASQARGRPRFRDELLGRIAALAALDPGLGARLRAGFDRIDWTPPG